MYDIVCVSLSVSQLSKGFIIFILISFYTDNQGEMERSLIHGFQRLLQLLLLSALLLTLALLPQARSQPDIGDIQCGVERISVNVTLEGCEPATTIVPVCNGVCISAVSTILEPPFSVSHCTSCQPINYQHNKMRYIEFTCKNGEKMRKKMYFPRIKECGCVNATVSVE